MDKLPLILIAVVVLYMLVKQHMDAKRLDVVAPKKTPDGNKIKYVPAHTEKVVVPAHTEVEKAAKPEAHGKSDEHADKPDDREKAQDK